MRIHIKCFRAIVAIALLIPTLSWGQIKITADTITYDCKFVIRLKTDIVIIDSQEQYDQAEFSNNDDGCAPFHEIDFDKSILAGFRYRGSNCEAVIHWSTIIETDNGYLIQFATNPTVCRDLNYRIAWFIIDRPNSKVDITFEKVFKKNSP